MIWFHSVSSFHYLVHTHSPDYLFQCKLWEKMNKIASEAKLRTITLSLSLSLSLAHTLTCSLSLASLAKPSLFHLLTNALAFCMAILRSTHHAQRWYQHTAAHSNLPNKKQQQQQQHWRRQRRQQPQQKQNACTRSCFEWDSSPRSHSLARVLKFFRNSIEPNISHLKFFFYFDK